MAKTNLKNYTVQEKLNKMDVDLIDVVCSPDADNQGAQAAGDLLFQVTEIPNAVAVPGGTALLQSVVAVSSGEIETGAFDLVFTSNGTALVDESGNAETGDVVTTSSSDIDSPASVAEGHCGVVSFNSLTQISTTAAVGDEHNLGIVVKAEEGSTSIYVYGIVQNTADYNEGRLLLRVGLVKD